MAETQPIPEDPLYKQSLSWHIALATVMFLASTAWMVYDEIWGRRPYKGFQGDFKELYVAHLDKLGPKQAEQEARIKSLPAYTELTAQIQAADAAKKQRQDEISKQVTDMTAQLEAIKQVLPTVRALVQAETYLLEKAGYEGDDTTRSAIAARIAEIKKGPHTVKMPDGRKGFTYDEMVRDFNSLTERRGALQKEFAEINRPASELRAKLGDLVKNKMTGPTAALIEGIKNSVPSRDVTEIKQIHVAQYGIIDRCESCHCGTREPVEIKAEDMGGRREFVSHPDRRLLEIHDPERFGCTPCHNGNGIALTSGTKGHGRHKYWLWPMYQPENVEAGCVKCHEKDLVLDHAPTLNTGRELFRFRGCWGCHPREGFDIETEQLQRIAVERKEIEARRVELERRKVAAEAIFADTNAPEKQVADAQTTLQSIVPLEGAGLDTRDRELTSLERSLFVDRKKVGPNLKDLKAKIRLKEWLPQWVRAPHEFRPDTKMPTFRLNDEQVQAVSAYLWQNATDLAALGIPLPKRNPGDVARGKELFETRGCMGCHTIGEGDQRRGDGFATNLTRVGEKIQYDFMVRWIENPRLRLLPYSPTLKRDVTPEDYRKQGLPFRFDDVQSRDPIEGKEMLVQNQTVMPSLRLSAKDAEDIATWLSQQHKLQDGDYPKADFLADAEKAKAGAHWIRHFGCAGCHEIAGMENEGRIGTELTVWGSKPIERIDFALLTHEAEHDGWYNHKGFAERKLAQPEAFDKGKEKESVADNLRMPNFRFSKEHIGALTTYLLGSTETRLPAASFYRPDERQKAIQEGWWVVKKYNCVGCHQLSPDQEPALWSLPQFSGDNSKMRPPTLVGQGARTDPTWLASFLANPALDDRDLHKNGLRVYLTARMPSFHLTENEIGKLVRFFAARSNQPPVHIVPRLDPLAGPELTMARDAFDKMDCAKCHAAGDPAKWTEEEKANIIAPSFLHSPKRLAPDWVAQWLVDPQRFAPGTKMPTGLFTREGGRWVTANPPESLKDWKGDHVQLLVRYLAQYDGTEAARGKK